jgi:hypothetical protein
MKGAPDQDDLVYSWDPSIDMDTGNHGTPDAVVSALSSADNVESGKFPVYGMQGGTLPGVIKKVHEAT